MADQDTTIPQMDDRELFQSTMEPEPKAETQPEQPEPASQERPRDEQGRFAPKQEQAEPVKAEEPQQATTAQPDTTKDQSGQVPSWRLQEVREQREAAERRAEEIQRQFYATQARLQDMERQFASLNKPKAEPPDWYANPDQAIQHHIAPIEERFAQLESQMRLNTSRAMAVVMHGKETIAEMEQALEVLPRNGPEWQSLAMRMRQSTDPVGIAVDWFKDHKVKTEVGGDIAAYKAKLLEDAMKDPAFQQKAMETWRGAAQQQSAQPGARPNIQLPPSINRATGSGASNAASDDIDINDGRAMFNYANAGKSGRR